MDGFTWNMILGAAGIALAHTAFGPDHYLPFIMLARSRNWKLGRTLLITLACGAGHVGSSFLLGMVGLGLGYGIGRIEGIEVFRGDIAAWLLILFGAAYALWGVRIAIRKRAGIVPHEHHGHVHVHTHGGRTHRHPAGEGSRTTFWTLFIIFVLGPCEPLIPFFVAPASRGEWALALTAGAVFAAVTLATMAVLVGFALAGLRLVRLGMMERWSHAMAGGVIACSGLAIVFLGL
jgi:hypothetical protein